MNDEIKLYSFADIKNIGLTDEQILDLLKDVWCYPKNKEIALIGQVAQISTDHSSFWIIENFYHIETMDRLLYPVHHEQNIKQTIYIGTKLNGNKLELENKQWIKAIVELAPIKEREKHNNPFEVVATKVVELKEMPAPISIDVFGKNDTKIIEKQWYELLYQSASQKVEQEISKKNVQLTELGANVAQSESVISEKQRHIDEIKEEIIKLNGEKESLSVYLENYQKEVSDKMSKLNQFIEKQANMLKVLNLIDDEQYHQFVASIDENTSLLQGHNFSSVFNDDVGEAIAYIQAYLYQQGIVYKKEVLEDFFALINTHDLIILAGDSGSGKTNLVKSFAKAIGGKSVIIPVKPNWTSAEDLLGYYNPLEQKYLVTPFLQAIFDAIKNPDIPYFICLDEMNLARVEYYFADFLSLMEERSSEPLIHLYSDTESNQAVNEIKMFLSIISDVIDDKNKNIQEFVDLLKDEKINQQLHDTCGFKEGDSLLKYHAYLRRLLNSYLNTPSSIKLPANVRIIGAINVDETTHYLSPKILDRAHIMRFSSPLLLDWDEIENEIQSFDLDMDLPVIFHIDALGIRQNYPNFDKNDELVEVLIYMAKNYLNPIGIEFGLRTIRQAQNYAQILQKFDYDKGFILNNIVIHKVLPKLMFDGEKQVKELRKLDVLKNMRDYLANQIGYNAECIFELDQMIDYATKNDSVVNYWAR